MPRPWRLALAFLVTLLCGGLAGCYSLSQPVPERRHAAPFKFQELRLPNGCFVEAVRFHDAYLRSVPESRTDRWVQVFQWGARLDDDSTGTGHAVALFVWKGELRYFDTNFGVLPLPVEASQRKDIPGFSPTIYGRYPNLHATMPMLMSDLWTAKRPRVAGDLQPVANKSHGEAIAIARELGRERETRVVRFTYLKDGKREESAAAVFHFDNKLCLYVPELGTLLGVVSSSVNNLMVVQYSLARSFGREAKVELVNGLVAK